MQQKFHVSLSTRPPHISCNLFSLCLSFLLKTIQNSTKKRINHRSKSLLGKDFLHTGGLWEIRIFKKGGGGLWEIQIFLRKSVC